MIRWPINRFNRFCDFLRFNRFNRFIEIIKSIFSKFWKLTNFRFLKKFQFSEFFCYELNFVNCWLETTHWKRLDSNSVHNEEMVPEQTTRRRCRTLHHQIACTLNQVSLGYIEHSFWWDHITRLSNADKKNRPGRSPTICCRFAELSDLRESKWDPEISWEIPPRYWKVFSKNRNNSRKESFSPNLIDNQSSL